MLQFKTISSSTLELLIKLQQFDSLQKTRLVGGTALALQYGHRISVDLDLFGFQMDLNFNDLITEIKQKNLQLEIRQRSATILISMINNVKVDIVNYPYDWIEELKISDNIRIANDKEIAAMKLSAITNRGSKKDFIDLYYLLQKYTLPQLISFYHQKYKDGSEFMLLKSLTYFEDAEQELTPKMLQADFNWNHVKHKIVNETMKLI